MRVGAEILLKKRLLTLFLDDLKSGKFHNQCQECSNRYGSHAFLYTINIFLRAKDVVDFYA